jgi:hypothetical protein
LLYSAPVYTMESLANIPLNENIKLSNQESDIMKEYFGDTDSVGGNASNDRETTLSWTDALKASGYGVLLFAILANPWINNLLYKIPQISNNPIMAFCIKLFIFMFMMFLMTKFAV